MAHSCCARKTSHRPAKRISSESGEGTRPEYHPHPHPQFNFASAPSLDVIHPINGLRLRTIMVSNVPPQLRDEKVLKEYFEYYMSRKLERPGIGSDLDNTARLLQQVVRLPFQSRQTSSSLYPTNRRTERTTLLLPIRKMCL